MTIDQKYFENTAKELGENLDDVRVQHGEGSPVYKLLRDLRVVMLTIINETVHPLQVDGMNTAKAVEVDNHEGITEPYNDLADAVFDYKKQKRETNDLVSARDNISIKVDSAVSRRNAAKRVMDAAFEKLHK